MNLVQAALAQSNGGYTVTLGSQTLRLADETMQRRPALRNYVGRTVTLGLRPSAFEDAAIETDHPHDQRLRGSVENVEALGFERIAYFTIDAKQVLSEDALDLGEDIEIPLRSDFTRVSARFVAASRVRVGDTVEAAVHTEQAHFFDPDTGHAIRS